MEVGLFQTLKVFASDPLRFFVEGYSDPVRNTREGAAVVTTAVVDVAEASAKAAGAVVNTAAKVVQAPLSILRNADKIITALIVLVGLWLVVQVLKQARLFGFGKAKAKRGT